MRLVLTLIAGSRDSCIDRLARAVATTIAAEPVWLAPGEACDFFLDAADHVPIEKAARGVIGDAAIDVAVQPAARRRKRLLVADLEATIIENEILDELADFVGLRPQVAELTRQAMNGEIDFAAALEARVGLLAGMDAKILEKAAERIRLTAGARELIATMRAAGAVTALVSGGFTMFAEQVAAELRFDRVLANRLDLMAGRLAGTVRPPVVDAEAKRQMLLTLSGTHRVPLAQTMAVGDGANDLPMLAAAGVGIAFHAKPLVATAARWRLDHADLTGLLYLQGFRKEEFVAAHP